MRGGGIQYSPFDAGALSHTRGYRRGYFGEYLFDIPTNNLLRFVRNGQPASGLAIDVYQSSLNTIRLNSKIYTGVTDGAGKIALPNRPVTAISTTATNHQLNPNPFGDIHVVGLNGILLIKISYGGAVEYKYIDISEFNLAYWNGNITDATYDINTTLAGLLAAPQNTPDASSITSPPASSIPPITPSAPSSSGSGNNNDGQSLTPAASNSPAAATGINATTTPNNAAGNQTQGTALEAAANDSSQPPNRQIASVAVVRRLVNAHSAEVEAVSGAEAQTIVSRRETSPLNNTTNVVYQRVMSTVPAGVAESARIAVAYFIHYGTPTTQILGAGERGGVVNSFYSAYKKFPQNDIDWQDAVKIANGRWPTQRNQASEKEAEAFFKKIYRREPQRANIYDGNAIMVTAYGLRPAQRNLNSEQAAIKSFKVVFRRTPSAAVDWDVVRAIAYSGAKR